MPRILTIMGSGETSPTMTKVHRGLLDRFGPPPVPAVMLDTPYGFQENAHIISSKAVAYFATSVQRTIRVASYRSADECDSLGYEEVLNDLRGANYVFAGPGSPSYALTHWSGTQVPALLTDKLRAGGCVTFASAAAVTLGAFAVPVYEVYKVGQRPHWLEGLDLLAEIGLRVAVVPHYDNAEGGNHDTRFCYMGERRLSALEELLPEDVFVLGVDEHTALILDLDEGSASVAGLGAVTARHRSAETTVPAGDTVSIESLAAERSGVARRPVAAVAEPTEQASEPLLDGIGSYEASFNEALVARDGKGAVKAVLELDDLLLEWSADTLQSDHLDRGRATIRGMLVRLGELADIGLRDPRSAVGPFVEIVLGARRQARSEGRFDDADALRDRLVDTGLEVRDTADGTDWLLP